MKILVVLSRFPYPLEKGDKLRAYHQLKQLSKKNEIVLFALSDTRINEEAAAHLKPFCSDIKIVNLSFMTIAFNLFRTLFKSFPFQSGYFYSPKTRQQFDAFVSKHKPGHIYCQLIRTAEYVKCSTIPKTLDYMDAFSKGLERRISSAPFYWKPFLKIEYKRLLKYEREIFSCFQNKTIISSQDKNLIPHPGKEEIVVISNGVNTDYFKPMERKKEFDILFNGNMNYPPNIESAEYLVKQILPLVRKEKPGVNVLISGATPSKKVLNLQSANVTVTGWVDDVRENFAKSRILVAPMLTSIGLQNKLLEAMAMQVPCITSTLANNALGAEDGKNILIADTPEVYAMRILSLLKEENRAGEIGMNGYYFVLQNYNWEKENEKLEKLFYL